VSSDHPQCPGGTRVLAAADDHRGAAMKELEYQRRCGPGLSLGALLGVTVTVAFRHTSESLPVGPYQASATALAAWVVRRDATGIHSDWR